MKKRILITAALPYANGPIHLGHIAGAYLPADCYARFSRLRGSDVLFISGSDEHGVAITLNAKQENANPAEYVAFHHRNIQRTFQHLDISFDHYSRTTWEGHYKCTQRFFEDLQKNGWIQEKVTEQLYSPKDRIFLADRYVIGRCPKCKYEEARGDECTRCGASYEATDLENPRAKLGGSPLVLRSTKHWFFRFDLFKKQLKEWIEQKEWKANVMHFAKNYIEELKPRAITRDSDWGVPVPLEEAEGKVFYVWFDAPIGYISATREWAQKVEGDPDAWKRYWLSSDTQLVQFVGKDNIPFHAIFFPAMIMGQDRPYKLVDALPANEFYHLEGKAFSKSTGWMIELEQILKKFSSDQVRYAIAANAPETQDSSFSWRDLQMRCNAELLGKYGNFVHRVLTFVQNYCRGMAPLRKAEEIDVQFLQRVHRLAEECAHAYSHFSLRKSAQFTMELAHVGNAYFDTKRPWKGIRNEEMRESMLTTISHCLWALQTLALISFPIIPQTANTLWRLLGHEGSLADYTWEEILNKEIPEGKKLPPPKILFRKVEEEEIEAEIKKLKNREEEMTNTLPPWKEEVEIDAFHKIDLRIAKILSAERIPKSKKLLKITVDIGSERRTIVSGIAEFYPEPDALIGKKIAVIVNIKPSTFMGVESRGMLLATGGSSLELLEARDAPPGTPIG